VKEAEGREHSDQMSNEIDAWLNRAKLRTLTSLKAIWEHVLSKCT